MKREIDTKFYTFSQNNSGGFFVEDVKRGVGEYVIIEAVDAKDALARLDEIGSRVAGFNNYCECCGERWSRWMDDSDGTEQPEIYGQPVEEVESSSYRKNAYVHYFDGTFKLLHLNDKRD
jgi:hypothetical protein